jgi:hypothetical protein
MKKTKQGRPEKNPADAQSKCVSVWFVGDDKEDVRKAAALAELPVSTWARKVLRDAARRALLADVRGAL